MIAWLQRRWGWVAATSLVVAFFAVPIADERNRIFFGGLSRTLAEGSELLGVRVGMERDQARDAVTRRGFEENRRDWTILEACGGHAKTPDTQLIEFRDKSSWRNGLACIVVADGRVRAMEVQYLPFFGLAW